MAMGFFLLERNDLSAKGGHFYVLMGRKNILKALKKKLVLVEKE